MIKYLLDKRAWLVPSAVDLTAYKEFPENTFSSSTLDQMTNVAPNGYSLWDSVFISKSHKQVDSFEERRGVWWYKCSECTLENERLTFDTCNTGLDCILLYICTLKICNSQTIYPVQCLRLLCTYLSTFQSWLGIRFWRTWYHRCCSNDCVWMGLAFATWALDIAHCSDFLLLLLMTLWMPCWRFGLNNCSSNTAERLLQDPKLCSCVFYECYTPIRGDLFLQILQGMSSKVSDLYSCSVCSVMDCMLTICLESTCKSWSQLMLCTAV